MQLCLQSSVHLSSLLPAPALVPAGNTGHSVSTAGNHSLKVVSWARERQALGNIPPATGLWSGGKEQVISGSH